MTTVYVPRLIESAEQAEALPIGTVLIRHRDDETTRVATRIHRGPSPDHVWRTGDGFHRHAAVVGMQALVPIEAEEEVEAASHIAGQITASGIEFTERTGEVASWQRRYVTPWVEDACPGDWESFTVTGEEA